MPLVKAIENGAGQTESPSEREGRCGVWTPALLTFLTRSLLERSTIEGESPVEVPKEEDLGYPE